MVSYAEIHSAIAHNTNLKRVRPPYRLADSYCCEKTYFEELPNLKHGMISIAAAASPLPPSLANAIARRAAWLKRREESLAYRRKFGDFSC
jgi:hypothetical protein